MPKSLTIVTPPLLMGIKGWFGGVWFSQGYDRLGSLWLKHRRRETPLFESRVGSSRGFWGVSLEFGFLLEFNFVGKSTHLVKGGVRLEF